MTKGYRIIRISAYGEATTVTEAEYLLREFGIVYKKIMPSELKAISRNEKQIVLVTQDIASWQDSLTKVNLPIIVFLIGNETYDSDKYLALNKVPNIKHAFIYNPPIKPTYKTSFLTLFGYILDGGLKNHETAGSVWRDFRISLGRKGAVRKLDIRIPYTNLNQGYSNNFAVNFALLHGKSLNESLLNLDSSRKLFMRDRSIKLQFMGQKTNRRRENVIRNALKYDAVVSITPSFGGTQVVSDSSYVDSLLDSEYTVVPPGHYNNFNHRYAESLICGSIPLILANNSLDPTPNSNWTKCLRFPANVSVKYQIRIMLEKSKTEQLQIWLMAYTACEREISQVRSVLMEHLK